MLAALRAAALLAIGYLDSKQSKTDHPVAIKPGGGPSSPPQGKGIGAVPPLNEEGLDPTERELVRKFRAGTATAEEIQTLAKFSSRKLRGDES